MKATLYEVWLKGKRIGYFYGSGAVNDIVPNWPLKNGKHRAYWCGMHVLPQR